MDAIVKNILANSAELGEGHKPSREEAEAAVQTLLRWMGENPAREGLIDTPKRVVNAYLELFAGYEQDPGEELSRTFEKVSGYSGPVTIRDIPFFSHCEHHMVPIIGKAHVSYLPDGKVVGLSKIARVVDIFAKRLQTQESMTEQVAQSITEALQPKGVAVLIEAEHMCMAMRGIRKQGSVTITSSYTGEYSTDKEEQLKFMASIGKS